jgi:hypothetical protein
MNVMDSKTFLEFYVSKIDEYLEKKPKHDFGFCWWVYTRYRQEHAYLCNEQNRLNYDMYKDMLHILRVYCEHHGWAPMEYLSINHGYNYERAHRLAEIRDGVLLPRIKELS